MGVEMSGRHYRDAPPPSGGWRCPACGSENAGRLELGCSACGGGAPGRHVGVDPLAPKKRSSPVGTSTPTGTYVPYEPTGQPSDIGQAFIDWLRPLRGQHDAATEGLLFEAFKAGALYAAIQTPQAGPPLTGTAESRTIAAALRLFMENILPGAGDEIASGEFLSIEETEQLIQRLERTV